MIYSPQPFFATMSAVVLGTFLIVMSVAFISIPMSLGGHPGEVLTAASPVVYHLT